MPVSKNALIRYKTIDRCLQNHYRRWTLDDLIDACSDALYELEGRDEGVSKRTVQLDIQNLRKLYSAPIKVIDHKYYIYEDEDFSITESPLSEEDVKQMSEAVKVLRELSGFQEFSGMEGIMGRLEDVVHIARDKSRPVVFFEKNDLLKGLEFIQPLHQAILNRHPVRMTYQSFKAKVPNSFTFHPYALKEFEKRWYVVAYSESAGDLRTFALDRIAGLRRTGDHFRMPVGFNVDTLFQQSFGIYLPEGEKPVLVKIRTTLREAAYLEDLPLHPSQMLVSRDSGSCVYAMRLIPNPGFIMELCKRGDRLEVLEPESLRDSVKEELKKALKQYEN